MQTDLIAVGSYPKTRAKVESICPWSNFSDDIKCRQNFLIGKKNYWLAESFYRNFCSTIEDKWPKQHYNIGSSELNSIMDGLKG